MSAKTGIDYLDATKPCKVCGVEKDLGEFPKNRIRPDGHGYWCKECYREWARIRYVKKIIRERPGPDRLPPREGDKSQARHRVNLNVRNGDWPKANEFPCKDCGHIYIPGGVDHEYDHCLGYGKDHHEVVDTVCASCHKKREWSRGKYANRKSRSGREFCQYGHRMVREKDGGWRCHDCRIAYFRRYNSERRRQVSHG